MESVHKEDNMNWIERDEHRHRNGAFLEAAELVNEMMVELRKMGGMEPSDYHEGARQFGSAIFDVLMAKVENERKLWEVAQSEGQVPTPNGASSFPPGAEADRASRVAPDALGAQFSATYQAPSRDGDGRTNPLSGLESPEGGACLSTQEEVPL